MDRPRWVRGGEHVFEHPARGPVAKRLGGDHERKRVRVAAVDGDVPASSAQRVSSLSRRGASVPLVTFETTTIALI